MADPAKEEREDAPTPSSSSPPPPPQDEPQEPLLDTFWRWPLLVLFLSYVFALYVRDATSTDTAATEKEAAGVVSSHQPPHTNGQAPVVIPPERTATASQDKDERTATASSSSLSFPIAGGGGGSFHQHSHILVQYCTS